jgi:hypothetical protein
MATCWKNISFQFACWPNRPTKPVTGAVDMNKRNDHKTNRTGGAKKRTKDDNGILRRNKINI